MHVAAYAPLFFLGVDLINGREYVTVIRATNMAGISSQAKSDGFIYDETMPNTGDISVQFQATRNSITAKYGRIL